MVDLVDAYGFELGSRCKLQMGRTVHNRYRRFRHYLAAVDSPGRYPHLGQTMDETLRRASGMPDRGSNALLHVHVPNPLPHS